MKVASPSQRQKFQRRSWFSPMTDADIPSAGIQQPRWPSAIGLTARFRSRNMRASGQFLQLMWYYSYTNMWFKALADKMISSSISLERTYLVMILMQELDLGIREFLLKHYSN